LDEARAPPDIIYGSPNEEPDETYDSFVERIRERSVTAFAEVRDNLKPKRFEVGQWVLYFNPQKLLGKQMKWIRQYEGLFLVVKVPSSVTAVIQRLAKARPKTVHIDKLKEFFGKPPKKWTVSGRSFVDEASPSVGAPFDGGLSSPTVEVCGDDLSEVICPLPMDKTNECSSDERLENTGISLVDEECSSPEAVVRAEEVQLGLDEVQFENPSDVGFVDEASSLVGAPFDGEVSTPTVFGEEVRQKLDEAQSENSPEVVRFHPDRVTDETKISEVVRFRPDAVTDETKSLSSDNVSDRADRAEKSLSECLLDKANDNVSNGASEAVDQHLLLRLRRFYLRSGRSV